MPPRPRPRLPAPRRLDPQFPRREDVPVDEVREALEVLAPAWAKDSEHVARRLSAAARLVSALSAIRAERGVSLAELSRRVGLDESTVKRLFRGDAWPAADLVVVLGEAMERTFELTRDGWSEVRAASREEAERAGTQAARNRRREVLSRESVDVLMERVRVDPELARRLRAKFTADRQD